MSLHNSALTIRGTATKKIALKRLAGLNVSCVLFFFIQASQTASSSSIFVSVFVIVRNPSGLPNQSPGCSMQVRIRASTQNYGRRGWARSVYNCTEKRTPRSQPPTLSIDSRRIAVLPFVHLKRSEKLSADKDPDSTVQLAKRNFIAVGLAARGTKPFSTWCCL